MLDYLYHVYMHPPSSRVMDINELEELFKQVIIPDLAVWKTAWADSESFSFSGGKFVFLEVVKRGLYENVTCNKKSLKKIKQDRRASAINFKITHTSDSVPSTPDASIIEH